MLSKIVLAFYSSPPLRKLIRDIIDNKIKQDMIITTQKYQTINITKLINTLNLNFIILNNKLIFTHKLTKQNLKDINKILKLKYSSCYKITK